MLKRLLLLFALAAALVALALPSTASASGYVTVTVIHCSFWSGCNYSYVNSAYFYQWNGAYYQYIGFSSGWFPSKYAPFNGPGYARVCTNHGCGNAYFGPTGGNISIRI